MDIPQDIATQLFKEGAVLIFLDMPEYTEFGIDMKAWKVGNRFRGVKMIPPGVHFIHFSPVCRTGDVGPRCGFFYDFKRSEVVLKKWDSVRECISPDEANAEEVKNYSNNIIDMDPYLGPYPLELYDKWCSLSSYITGKIMEKLVPECGLVRSALDLVSCDDKSRPRASGSGDPQPSTSSGLPMKRRFSDRADIETDLLPKLKPVAGTDLRFSKFPDRSYPVNSTPSEITKFSLDSGYVLDFVLSQHSNPTDILGELQFAFVCFLIGHSLDAFEQWKLLIGALCSSETSITKYRLVYDHLVSVLEIQILEIPPEFLADIVTNNNFVYCKLRDLFRYVQASGVDGRLKSKVCRFKENLTKHLQWDFTNLDEEDDDEAPVVVEL